MTLVDIRFEKYYWKKPVENTFAYGLTLMDSVMIFANNPTYAVNSSGISKVATIALNEQFNQSNKIVLPNSKDLVLRGEGWKYKENVTIRPWHSGLILANSKYYSDGSKGNHYALIDTIAGTFERFTPSGEFEWINECNDVKWSSIGGLCLKQIPDTTGFVLLKNGVDTLAVRYNDADKVNYLFFSGSGIVLNGPVYLMNNQGQVSEYSKRFMW